MASNRFQFTLILGSLRNLTQVAEDRLFAAGCEDALVGQREGVVFLDFDRQADSLETALLSAIRDVRRAKVGATVVRVEPDDLVNQAEIARRLGQSRESVRKYVGGQRGSGDFPAPVSGVKGTSAFWRWSEVADWLNRQDLLDQSAVNEATLIAAVNSLLAIDRSGAVMNLAPLMSAKLAAALSSHHKSSKPRRPRVKAG